MSESGTMRSERRWSRSRVAIGVGATVLALGALVGAAGPASAGEDALPVQGTPAPGWEGHPVEERCVAFGPGHGPGTIEPGNDDVVFEPGDGPVVLEVEEGQPGDAEHGQQDRVIHRRAAPGRIGHDGDHIRMAPEAGCDQIPVPGPQPEPWPGWRDTPSR